MLESVISLGDRSLDSDQIKQKNHFMIYMGLIMSMGGLTWGGLSAYFGLYFASLFPFAYAFITPLNFYYFNKTKNFGVASFIQVFISLALPFFFQWSLGGFVSSGAVMLWAILAVIGSLSFHQTKVSRVWIVLFILFTLLSWYLDPLLHNLKIDSGENISVMFLVLNITVVSSAVYFLVVFFIDIRDEAHHKLEEQQEEIISQSEALEKRNIDITDSINYAKKIQDSILPSDELMRKIAPNSFIIFRPKDIVSGDFYWLKENKDGSKFYFTVADCTGHGVPGAFMSLISSSLFERAVKTAEFQSSPDKVLSYVRFKIIEGLKQGEGSQKDGIDAGVFCFDKVSNILSYSSSYVPLFILRPNDKPLKNIMGEEIESKEKVGNNNLYVIKGSKQPISYYYGKEKDFVLNQFHIEKDDQIFLTSDGFLDQFGGENSAEKFTVRRFRDLIFSIADLPTDLQKKKILEALESWKANTNQTDDICVFGMKF